MPGREDPMELYYNFALIIGIFCVAYVEDFEADALAFVESQGEIPP